MYDTVEIDGDSWTGVVAGVHMVWGRNHKTISKDYIN